MSKKLPKGIVYFVVVILIVVFAILKTSAPKEQALPEQPATQVEQTDNSDSTWKTFSDKATGLSFKYPKDLGTTYIHPQDWPPQVQIIEGSFACTNAGEETARAGKTETRKINGRDYCVTTVTEGAAGSTYTQYAYAAQNGNKTLYFTFTIRSVQCANYEDPQKTECENERQSFDIDNLTDKIIQTAKLVAPTN